MTQVFGSTLGHFLNISTRAMDIRSIVETPRSFAVPELQRGRFFPVLAFNQMRQLPETSQKLCRRWSVLISSGERAPPLTASRRHGVICVNSSTHHFTPVGWAISSGGKNTGVFSDAPSQQSIQHITLITMI
jgi:hypothetical protein